MKIEAIKNSQAKAKAKKKKEKKADKPDAMNKTLQGVLINNHVRTSSSEANYSFNDIQDSLLICDSDKFYSKETKQNDEEGSSFNIKKALLPTLAGTALLVGGCFGLSTVLKKSTKYLLNTKNYEQLPDLAINMNIKQEPEFAIYRAIRDPNSKNLIGAAAVFLMSGITIGCKNFVEGAKEVWLKKQSADIEKDLQEKLIDVETNAFSGKLKVVNDLMNNNVKYFDSILNTKKDEPAVPPIFAGFTSFKGRADKKENTEKQVKINKNIKYLALVGGVIAGSIALGKLSLNNLRKTAEQANQFANNYAEKTINAINNISDKADPNDIPKITEFLKSICAKPEYIKEVAKKYNLADDAVQGIINAVEESKKTIFADAPVALGGIPQKVQYYCYIDENRGHLYNMIINPENKFTKYIFAAFTTSSAIGYLFKQGMDAIKEATVMKENAKTELDLRKRLVDVEIENFKSKKESAIMPLVDNFTKQANDGSKTKEELKQLADNILMETKNGPPYVYN